MARQARLAADRIHVEWHDREVCAEAPLSTESRLPQGARSMRIGFAPTRYVEHLNTPCAIDSTQNIGRDAPAFDLLGIGFQRDAIVVRLADPCDIARLSDLLHDVGQNSETAQIPATDDAQNNPLADLPLNPLRRFRRPSRITTLASSGLSASRLRRYTLTVSSGAAAEACASARAARAARPITMAIPAAAHARTMRCVPAIIGSSI